MTYPNLSQFLLRNPDQGYAPTFVVRLCRAPLIRQRAQADRRLIAKSGTSLADRKVRATFPTNVGMS